MSENRRVDTPRATVGPRTPLDAVVRSAQRCERLLDAAAKIERRLDDDSLADRHDAYLSKLDAIRVELDRRKSELAGLRQSLDALDV